jgi:RimJ/RimL family protein N-acetyltransferase
MSEDFAQVALRTPRLQLQPLRDTDAAGVFALYADEQVCRYLAKPPLTTIDEARALIAADRDAHAAGTYLRLGIDRLDDSRLIGECTLHSIDTASRRAELGYALSTGAQGRGYMAEALEELLDFAFGVLALNRIEAEIDPRNLASAKSLERLGFAREGLLRERWIVRGEVSDSALYGLLGPAWRLRRHSAQR